MNPCFGGILIRSIIKYDNTWKKQRAICGPQKCVDELFDVLNAVDNSKELTPLLIKHNFGNVEVASTQRFIKFDVPTKNLEKGSGEKEYQKEIRKLAQEKLEKILSENKRRESNANNGKWLIASEEQNTSDLFCDYMKAKYRYHLKDLQWEKGYKAANMDKDENSYKYLLVT
jgi:hypothetical protein